MYWFLICLFATIHAIAYQASIKYGLYAHDLEEETPITQLQIFGERHSGTNYLLALLLKNFPQFTEVNPFGGKHIPPWYTLPAGSYPGPQVHYTLKGSDACLFVVIFRHPFDWLHSMNQFPYHASAELHHISLHRLIKTPWEIASNAPEDFKIIEKDPATGLLFKNLLHLRTAKIQNLLYLKSRVSHVYYVNYEIVRDFPEKVVEEIADFFDFDTPDSFIPVLNWCSGDASKASLPFTKQPPYEPAPNLRQKILKELDLDLERSIGYPLMNLSQ